MNFKKMAKRFFTLSQNHDGFTLVELIVVIAIMAILAGVAVPAYTGYINKANKASDLQLLGAINTAFGAACMEENIDVHTLNSQKARLDIGNDGSISYNTITPVDTQEAFLKYINGNDDTFKVIRQLIFVNGVFVDPTSGSVEGLTAYTYAGGTIYLTDADVETLVNSTFLTASGLGGSAGLLDKVNSVTNIAAGMAGSLEKVWGDPTFTQNAMKVLGVTTQEEYNKKQDEMIAALQEKNPGMSRDQAVAQLAANSTVLYAADSAVKFTDAQINELFAADGTGVETIKNNLKGDNTTAGMAQAALVYGMYTAYANQPGNEALLSNTENPVAVLNALEGDPAFKTYVNSAQGQADLDAYMGALGMITDSAASDPSAVEHLMVNGFNNAELKDLLAGATGK